MMHIDIVELVMAGLIIAIIPIVVVELLLFMLMMFDERLVMSFIATEIVMFLRRLLMVLLVLVMLLRRVVLENESMTAVMLLGFRVNDLMMGKMMIKRVLHISCRFGQTRSSVYIG